MKYKINYGDSVISLPGKTGGLLRDAGGVELRTLIYLSLPGRAGGDTDPEEIALALGVDAIAVRSALAYLASSGLITPSDNPRVAVKEETTDTGKRLVTVTSSDIPQYTGAEIERLFENDPDLSGYVNECQKTLGRMFSLHETNKMLALREYYALEAEYVVMICEYCKSKGRATVPYVEKVAKNMIDLGITTVPALEDRIAYLSRYDGTESLVRTLCGAGARALTKKEKRFIEEWTGLSLAPGMIELAYEIAVNNTGSPSLPYMNRVLLNWRDSGCDSVERVLAGMEDYRKRKEAASGAKNGSFETDEFFEAALKRALKKHEEDS